MTIFDGVAKREMRIVTSEASSPLTIGLYFDFGGPTLSMSGTRKKNPEDALHLRGYIYNNNLSSLHPL